MRVLAVLGALILSGAAAGQAGAAPSDRGGDPVVIKGSTVPAMEGLVPNEIVAFKWDGGWQQVPVQVDERKVVSVGTLYPDNPIPVYVINNDLTFDVEVYADAKTRTGPDDDPTLDSNDEIAFMGGDTGEKVTDGSVAAPGGVVAGNPVTVTVTDPVGGGEGYVYMFQSDGSLDPSAGKSYVDYEFKATGIGPGQNLIDDYGYSNASNPEDSTVTTPYYTLHSTGRWSEDEMRIHTGGASGADILDREAAQHTLSGCGRSEVTFSGNWTVEDRGGDFDEGTYVTITDGPVRAIRSYMGANSGPYVQREHVYYGQREDNDIYLRVHRMQDLYAWTDYSEAAAGMTYRNFKNPAGVTVDGVPDSLTPATTADFGAGMVAWEQLAGPQGSVNTLTSVDSTIDPPDFGSLYLDDSAPDAPNERQCGGDGKAYGNSGFGIGVNGKNTPNTDPRLGAHDDLTVHRTRYFGAPGENAGDAARLADRVKEPLQAAVSGFVPATPRRGKAKLRFVKTRKKTLKVRRGKKVKFKVRVKNVGKARSARVRVCLRGPGVGDCSMSRRSRLAPGKAMKRRISFRVKRRFRRGRLIKLRIRASAKGAKGASRVVRIRVR